VTVPTTIPTTVYTTVTPAAETQVVTVTTTAPCQQSSGWGDWQSKRF
jgi:hypothetical protein